MDGVTLVAGLMMMAGLIGIVVPLLPGLLLIWAAVLVWALAEQTPAGWVILVIASTLTAAGILLKYVVPGRRMAKAGVTTISTLAGVALGIVGFFVIPVLGALVGFVLGVYLAERVRLGAHGAAWPSTKHALTAIALSTGIELVTGLAVATTWLAGVTVTA